MTPEYPRLWRRLAACLYESLPMLAIIFATGLVVVGTWQLTGNADVRLPQPVRAILFALCWLALGAYCVHFWSHGQTLAMRAWRLRLEGPAGGQPTRRDVVVRFTIASIAWGLALFGLLWLRDHGDSITAWLCLAPLAASLAWVYAGKDRQTLYDRLSRTRLIVEPKPAKR